MRQWTRRVAAVALVGSVLAGVPLAAHAEDEHAVLALPADVMQFLGIYAAEDLGFWKQQGLDVKMVTIAGIGAFNAVVSGSVEFSVSSGAALTRAAAHGQRMLAIANMIDKPVWTIVVSKKIADAAHFDPHAPLAVRAKLLQGKRMGVDGVNSVVDAYLRVIAKAGGFDPESMIIAPLPPAETVAAFSRHALDGFAGGPPWPQQVIEDRTAVAIASPTTGDPDWIAPNGSGVIVTRPQFCIDHRSVCEKMGHGLAEGAKFIHDQPQEALALMKKHFDKIDPAVVERSFQAIEIGTPVPPRIVAAVLSNSERLNIEAGLMAPSDKLKSYDGLFTDAFVR
ncbi:MAG TPA: ABC transporter substrate-binding protein [Stellaceae bacterium]|nr:ABC transporter substrate-binding protein [Stellaceae bacterium]